MSDAQSWIAVSRRRDIVTRSLRVAAVVGTILVTINYADKILSGTLSQTDWIKMLLTYCVPYCVSTYAAVGATLASEAARQTSSASSP